MKKYVFLLITLLLVACGGSSSNSETTSFSSNRVIPPTCVNPHTSSYPEEFLGEHEIPDALMTLPHIWHRGLSFKDYFTNTIPRNVDTQCSVHEYKRLMTTLTLDRMVETGTTMAWIYNYGPWDSATAEHLTVSENYYQISLYDLEFMIEEAKKRNIDIYYAWQFTTEDIYGRSVVELSEHLTPEKMRWLLEGFRTQVIKMAKYAEEMGIKGVAADWNAMDIGNIHDPEIKRIYIEAFSEIIDRIRENFSGEITWGQMNQFIFDAEVVNKVDAIHITLGGHILTEDENAKLTVNLIEDRIVHQLNEIYDYVHCFTYRCEHEPTNVNIPVHFEIAIQSRDLYWVEGWVEDGFCVSGTRADGTHTNCIQTSYVTDFSVQAIGIEGILRALVSQQHSFNVKGVNFHTSYWLTDTLVPGEEGFPNISQSIRGKPAEDIVKYWYTR